MKEPGIRAFSASGACRAGSAGGNEGRAAQQLSPLELAIAEAGRLAASLSGQPLDEAAGLIEGGGLGEGLV